jgi:FAD dependent oxidoreductase TIGR03364
MVQRFDDVVIGAGIVGLAHAFWLARRGRRVAVFERSAQADGASVRNFGMIWPIGQPAGAMRILALRSRAVWSEVLADSGIWYEGRGSLHLAYHDDEWQVLNEFVDRSAAGLDVRLVSPAAVMASCPRVQPKGLRGALSSATELAVDARHTCARLAAWLAERFDVALNFHCAVTAVELPAVAAGGRRFEARRAWVCSGTDVQALFPESFAGLGLVPCKLQMMASEPLSERIGPMLAAGLTLRHYAAFADCPTLPALRARVARDRPEFDRFGIHVMVSQNAAGQLILGDSHEYGADIDAFDKPAIDELILDYLNTFVNVPELRVVARWHGVYLKHPTRAVSILRPAPGVVAVTGVGGAGMTLSMGLAELVVTEELEADA